MRLRRMLAEALRAQRARLEQSRAGIEEAIHVLQQLETPGDATETPLLDRLAAGVEMLDALEAMRGYFSDEAWTKWGAAVFPRLAVSRVARAVPGHRSVPRIRIRRASGRRSCSIERRRCGTRTSDRTGHCRGPFARATARRGSRAIAGRASCSVDTRNSRSKRSRRFCERPPWRPGAAAAWFDTYTTGRRSTA